MDQDQHRQEGPEPRPDSSPKGPQPGPESRSDSPPKGSEPRPEPDSPLKGLEPRPEPRPDSLPKGSEPKPEPRPYSPPEAQEPRPEPGLDSLSRVQRSGPGPSPGSSCLSCKSDQSIHRYIQFKRQAMLQESSAECRAAPSSVFCRSEDSMENRGIEFKNTKPRPGPTNVSYQSSVSIHRDIHHLPCTAHVEEGSSDVPRDQQRQSHLDSIFKLLEEKIFTFVRNELKKFQKVLNTDYPEYLETQKDVDEEQRETREAFLKFTLKILRGMKEDEVAYRLESRRHPRACEVKDHLQQKFQYLPKVIAREGNQIPLNQIHTKVKIIKGEAAEVNDEHEIRLIETAFRKSDKEDPGITCEDIFEDSADRDEPIRTILTKGVAGIGKTVLTQKFCLDWAENKANQSIHLIFPLTFKELNMLKDKKFSLVELIHHFFNETKDIGTYIFEDFRVLFIFDGLDECRIPLDFHKTQILTDITEPASVDVLLINLIRGDLLPSTRLWITTRPAAANQIPAECVDMVTEIKGFTDEQKEEYFRKRFKDEEQANIVINHIETSRSLHIMCHIPLFCWITATVLDHALKTTEGRDLPKTLTEMFIHFLVVQAKLKNVKYHGRSERDSAWSPDTMKMIESLGKLAFEQLQKGNLIFYESDLTECGIDIKAATWSGVFTEVFVEESGLYKDKVFCFVHLSVQEFLAALHVYLTFINTGVNLLSEEQTTSQSSESAETIFYQTAVDKALQSPNGHLDLFLRFLLGLSLQTNQNLLRGLLKRRSSTKTNQETAEYIKKKLSETLSAERSINLFHCLNELNDRSLVDQIQHYLSSGHVDTKTLSPAEWSALVFILLSSEKNLDVFDLRKYAASKEALLRLLPVVKASQKAQLSGCNLSETSCKALSSVLSSESSNMRQLDLSNNELPDSGVSFLCDGLKKTTCALEELSLSGCYLTDTGCKSLASVISHKFSSLKVLDLSNNDLTDSAVKSLCDGMKSTNCTLETLRLTGCDLSQRSCEVLSSVLSSVSCSLRTLDLSNNDLMDSGVRILSDGLKSTHCSLQTLRLSGCLITEESCASLASALSSSSSHLRELDLSYNHPGDSGVKLLQDPHLRLDILNVDHDGEQWLKPGLRKYLRTLTLDLNTAHQHISLSNNNKTMTFHKERQDYPDHLDRFEHVHAQVMCNGGLTGRCYWEVVWTGFVYIAVTYRGIRRRGTGRECAYGRNEQSWILDCSGGGYSVWHNDVQTNHPHSSTYSPSGHVAVYVDCPAGSVSFYRVCSDTLIHIHTFNTTFTEPLYAGFRFETKGSTMTLCDL